MLIEILTISFIAVALAMDAFAVSVVSGSLYKKIALRHTIRIAAFFGFFQAIMPLMGSAAAVSAKKYIENFDHWIAFGILSAIGVKMIYEAFKFPKKDNAFDISSVPVLLMLSIATSIDALAVGVTLGLITTSVLPAAALIGIVTFILSCTGVYIGKKFAHFSESKIEAFAGIVLIIIGLKIVMEHIF